jgi:cell wall-associated NlpC family hydrolase
LLTIQGEVDSENARQAALKAFSATTPRIQDRIRVLPESDLREKTSGIITLSVANGREAPDHKAEMGTQWFMGEVVKVWKSQRFWLLVQGADGYLAWIEHGSLVNCSPREAQNWEKDRLGIVTDYETVLRTQANPLSDPVSDLVMGDRVRMLDHMGDWVRAELPDGRRGFLAEKSVEDWRRWKENRKASGENIERTARLFLGRPYLWGGCSPKGMDCSGFTRQVFLLNGILLPRNAAEQADRGSPVEVGTNYDKLRKGDLLFFGRKRARRSEPEVTHVAIYLGEKMFIQSAQRVRLSSLDPRDQLFDERHVRQLLSARRVLPQGTEKN